MSNKFKVVETNPPAPEQARLLMESGGCVALARLVAGHVKRGLERGTWVVADGKAVPVAMLHFYQENDTMAEEKTCEPIVR
jgi:hypothetical protein